jgi:poly-gamma-glutamate capsule biosynthesis protein CapA/YwtB (metallophosphatase superfamily)
MGGEAEMPDDAACRRLAAQLAAQLPETKAKAMKTIEYLRELADTFMYPAEEPAPDNVVPLPRLVAD